MNVAQAIWALAIAGAIGPVGLGKEVTKAELLSEYEPAAQRLERFYRSIRITTIRTRSNWERGPLPPSKWIMYAEGDELRVDRFEPLPGRGPEQETQYSTVADEHASFGVSRESGSSAFVLRNLSNNQEKTKSGMVAGSRFIMAPYGDHQATVLEVLKSPGVAITSVTEENVDGETLVRVSYTNANGSRDGKPNYSAWYLFSKDKSWALRGARIGTDRKKMICADIDYGEMAGPFPLLKQARFWTQVGDDRKQIDQYDVLDIEPGAASARDFQLATFGIRDIQAEKETNYWLYLIVAGVVLIAAAIVLTRVSARRRGSS